MTHESVSPKSLDAALARVRNGARLFVSTMTRLTVIDAKTVRKFDKAGEWLLREDGDGYRLRSGRSSVYLMPGQLRITDEDR